MHTSYKQSIQSAIPRYEHNAVLQLIIASGVTLIMYHFTRIVMLTMNIDQAQVYEWLVPNVSLPEVGQFIKKPWTLFTYGWVHEGFWAWATNMIWLYCFGSVLQSISDYKQLIPLYLFGLTMGGIFYLGGQFIPNHLFEAQTPFFMGAEAGVTSFGIAALVVSPRHRMYLAPQFTIPIIIIVAVYLLLHVVMALPSDVPLLMLHAGGAVAGIIYGWQLRRGALPGNFIYAAFSRIESIATPDERKIASQRKKKREQIVAQHSNEQNLIDALLDKINERGYNALSREEKETLKRIGRD